MKTGMYEVRMYAMKNGRRVVRSEIQNDPSSILNQALRLLRDAEAEIGKLKERSADIEADPNIKSVVETGQNDFIEHIYDLIDYWQDLPGKSLRERMEGLVFSILVTLDGESGDMPPYAVKPIDENGHEGEDIGGYLHELFSRERRKV